ncbi:MAG TPA: SgcJ/EcaC family oxidoreductase [Chitinophagaceae bacterium]|jgi:uncharacterized protein (TIGR02246 family)
MKNIGLIFLLQITGVLFMYGQDSAPDEHQRKAIAALIDQYAEAREKRDTMLLKTILTDDVDQLVSAGEWRNGIGESVEGMLKSSANSPGTRTLTISNIRMFTPNSAIVDCKYEIQNKDGTARKMWSTFIVVADKGTWKISAIRNMLPAGQ